MDMVFPNPIDKRLDFVRKQYGQETYEKTREIVARNLGIAEADIAPGQRVDWEKFIPWLGKQVHRLLKQGPRAAPELEKLERGFQASIEPFMKKVKGRRADIARLSPKRARQFAGRQQRAVGEAKGEQAKKLGYKEVARLGNGYTAVVAIIKPWADVPTGLAETHEAPVWRRAHGRAEENKKWVEENAPFQHWLGVELGNCLQFYRVNYEPHGTSQYHIQQAGGKLYGILDSKGKPVAAILTEKDGSIRETNGPGNRPPPEKDQEYVDKFITKHLKQNVKDAAFHPPEEFPEALTGVIEYTLDAWTPHDLHGRRRFLRKVQGYSRQQGADFSKVWPLFAIYALEESPHSGIRAIRKGSYSRKSDVIAKIQQVVTLYKKNGAPKDFYRAEGEAQRTSDMAWMIIRDSDSEYETTPEGEAAYERAQGAEEAAKAAGTAIAAAGVAAAPEWRRRFGGTEGAMEMENAGLFLHTAVDTQLPVPSRTAIRTSFSDKFLLLMRDAARAAGGAQPRDRAGNPTGARALIKDCQTTWESYCEKPGKTRLKKVFSTLKKMETSKATTVKAERSRCLRSARAEDRKHGYGLT